MKELSGLLIDWIKDKEKELTDEIIKLISDDAPKNKFSIIAGKKKMLEEFESAINSFDKKE